MISDGFVLAGLTVAGFYFLYVKLPKRVKKFLMDRPLFTDASAALFTYMIFGGTATALMAAGWACLITSIIIHISKNKVMMSWVERIKLKIREVFTWIETIGAEDEKQLPAAETSNSVVVELP